MAGGFSVFSLQKIMFWSELHHASFWNGKFYLVINIFAMKTILVATDYSTTATNALEYGASLAHIFDAELILFNVYNLSAHVRNALISPEAIEHIVKNNEERLWGVANEIAERHQIRVKPVVKTADTVEVMEIYLNANPIDLVVMGMDSNLTEYQLFGNTTTAAIRTIKYPLLVIPNDVSFDGIKKILYACEHTYLSKGNHLSLLKEMAKKFDAQLQVLHVEAEIKEQTEIKFDEQVHVVDAILQDTKHSYSLVKNASVGAGILQEVQAWQADLLVMVPHKTHLLEFLLRGSATRRMALTTQIPLLVLPNT